jgi:hypothetical protein
MRLASFLSAPKRFSELDSVKLTRFVTSMMRQQGQQSIRGNPLCNTSCYCLSLGNGTRCLQLTLLPLQRLLIRLIGCQNLWSLLIYSLFCVCRELVQTGWIAITVGLTELRVRSTRYHLWDMNQSLAYLRIVGWLLWVILS